MRESGKTGGWFTVGISLIVLGAGIYGLLILFGIGFAIDQASQGAGAPLWGELLIPGLFGVGVLVIFAKVIVYLLTSAEEYHYYNNDYQ
ncbi:MAG: hypothetical protein AAF642_19655, partial [Pseudomonadota bacterium]